MDLELSLSTVILNKYRGPVADLINTAILVAKHYIYACKCMNEDLTIIGLAPRLYNMLNLEKIIANRGHKMFKYDLKWSSLS